MSLRSMIASVTATLLNDATDVQGSAVVSGRGACAAGGTVQGRHLRRIRKFGFWRINMHYRTDSAFSLVGYSS